MNRLAKEDRPRHQQLDKRLSIRLAISKNTLIMAKKSRQRRSLYDPSVDPTATAAEAGAKTDKKSTSLQRSSIHCTIGSGGNSPMKARQLLESLGSHLSGSTASESSIVIAGGGTVDNEPAEEHNQSSSCIATSIDAPPLTGPKDLKDSPPIDGEPAPIVSESAENSPKSTPLNETTPELEEDTNEKDEAPAAASQDIAPLITPDKPETPSKPSFFRKISSVTAAVLTRSSSDEETKKYEDAARTADCVDDISDHHKPPTEGSGNKAGETAFAKETVDDDDDDAAAVDRDALLEMLQQEKDVAMQMATRLSVDLASARAALDDWQTQAEYWKEQYEQLSQQSKQEEQALESKQDELVVVDGTEVADEPAVEDVPAAPADVGSTPTTTSGRRLSFWKLTSPLRSSKAIASTVSTLEPEDEAKDGDIMDTSQVFGDAVYLELFADSDAAAETSDASASPPFVVGDNETREVLKQLQMDKSTLEAQLQTAQAQLRESTDGTDCDARRTIDKDDEGSEPVPPPPQASSPQSTMDFVVQEHEKLPDRWSRLSSSETLETSSEDVMA